MIVGFGSMSAEQDVAIVMHCSDLQAGAAQHFVGVSASRAPHGIEDHSQTCLANHIEIDDFTQAFHVGGLGIDGLVCRRSCGTTFGGGSSISRDNFRLDLFRDLGQGRTTVGS